MDHEASGLRRLPAELRRGFMRVNAHLRSRIKWIHRYARPLLCERVKALWGAGDAEALVV